MKHNIFFICLIVFIQLFTGAGAEAERTSIQELVVQANDASALPTAALEEMAFTAYEVLIEVPFTGVQDSLPELEQALLLKQALEKLLGLRERLLAVTITEGIDRLLLFEAARRTSAIRGRIVPPPFLTGSFQADTVKTLLQQNRIDEREAVAYIRDLEGRFATFCRSKNFRLEDFLTGHVASAFSHEWRAMLGQRAALWQSSVERLTLEDLLFGLILTVIDQGKDVEMLCDIYDAAPSDPEKKFKIKTQLKQRLNEQPVIRLSFGGYTSPGHVYTTLQKYLGNGQEYWALKLTRYFVPFFQKTDERLKVIREIFARYDLAEREIDSLPPFGVWLEPIE